MSWRVGFARQRIAQVLPHGTFSHSAFRSGSPGFELGPELNVDSVLADIMGSAGPISPFVNG